jgi:hypothetical protein
MKLHQNIMRVRETYLTVHTVFSQMNALKSERYILIPLSTLLLKLEIFWFLIYYLLRNQVLALFCMFSIQYTMKKDIFQLNTQYIIFK